MTPEHEQIFNKIYKTYYNKIVGFCVIRLNGDEVSADEITQEVFFTLSMKWDSLTLYSEPALVAWAYRAAKNLIYNHMRSTWRHNNKCVSLEEYTELGEDIPDDTSLSDQVTYQSYIDKIRKELSAEEWKLFNYVVIQKYNMNEVALILDVKFNTAKTRWTRLRQKLQKILKDIIK